LPNAKQIVGKSVTLHAMKSKG